MKIDHLGKSFEQINQEVEDILDQKESCRLNIIELYKQKDWFEEYKKISSNQALVIANKMQEEYKKIDNPSSIFKKISKFRDYRFSYLGAVILTRNGMIKEENTNLVYSYLFLISHYIELIIKAALLSKNEEIQSTHNIEKIFTDNREYLLEIGLEQIYFDFTLEQISKLRQYATTADFSMCFRYPLDNKFENGVITNKLTKITIEELQQMVEEHKYLMIILELIIGLSEKYFYEEIYKFIFNLFNEFEVNIIE